MLDNLSSHKRQAIRKAIRAVGGHLVFLPPYSRGLNPIELMFANLKQLLQKAAKRAVEARWRQIGELLGYFTPIECATCLVKAEYAAA